MTNGVRTNAHPKGNLREEDVMVIMHEKMSRKETKWQQGVWK